MKSSIQLAKLRLDGGTQPRVKIDTDVVADYAERIAAGDEFPPVEVFHDGADYWLAEGFHRYHGHAKAGKKTIGCNVRKGTVRDAILFSCGANIAHGLRRTNPDKQRAVMTLLQDDEWSKYSDRKIAEICCVDNSTVSSYRKQLLESNSSIKVVRRIGKDGKLRPATQPKRVPVPADEGWEPGESETDPPVPVAIKGKAAPNGEPNVIGALKDQIDDFVDGLLSGRPPYVRIAIAEHLEELAERLK